MAAFFCKLIPPRPTFAQDMSEAEAKIMEEHAAYWHDLLEKGRAVTFGLVADPAGAYGIAVVDIDGDAAVRQLTENDPAILSRRGFRFEVHPMPFGAARP
jgi:uncharacterized protein